MRACTWDERQRILALSASCKIHSLIHFSIYIPWQRVWRDWVALLVLWLPDRQERLVSVLHWHQRPCNFPKSFPRLSERHPSTRPQFPAKRFEYILWETAYWSVVGSGHKISSNKSHLISHNTGSGRYDPRIKIRIGLHSNLDGIKWLADIGASNGTDTGREQISGNGAGISDCSRHCCIDFFVDCESGLCDDCSTDEWDLLLGVK